MLIFSSCREKDPEEDMLASGFKDPPVEARPRGLWDWVNGNFSFSAITRELEEAKKMGMGGFDIWDVGVSVDPNGVVPAGPAFLSDASLHGIAHAVREAERLGLELGLIMSSSWNAGGTWISPKHTAMHLYRSIANIQEAGLQRIELPFPEMPKKYGNKETIIHTDPETGKPLFFEEVAILAIPCSEDSIIRQSEIINLSTLPVENDAIQWQVPAGCWNIVRYVCAPSGQPLAVPSKNSVAPMLDHFSKSAQQENINYITARLKTVLGNLENRALKYLYNDSYEVNSGIWTPGLHKSFDSLRGYEMALWLPVLDGFTVESTDYSHRFMFDYQKVLSDLIIENHYREGTRLCEEQGLGFAAEAGGPGAPIHNVPFEDLKALGALSIPRGEFWNKHPKLEQLQIVKGIASAAHIYNKKYVEAEAFTSVWLWQEGPAELKPLADRAMAEGLNRFVYHTFPHVPPEAGKPGWVYNFGTLINTTRAWWPLSSGFHNYLARCSYMLQQGNFVVDVAWYYGDKAPNFASPAVKIPGLSEGYDYDAINTEILLEKMQVRDGKLCLPHGQCYELLILKNEEAMNEAVLEKVHRLIQEGAWVLGTKPEKVYGFKDYQTRTQKLKTVAFQIWGDAGAGDQISKKIGKGMIFQNVLPDEILHKKNVVADFSFSAQLPCSLQYIHRQTRDADIYFVRNAMDTSVAFTAAFRASGRSPELWNPANGEKMDYPVFRKNGMLTEIPLHLAANESCIMVFRTERQPQIVNIKMDDNDVFNRPEVLSHPFLLKGNTENIFGKKGRFEILKGDGTRRFVSLAKDNWLIRGEWEIRFPHGYGAPPFHQLPKLMSWTEADDVGIQHFSGVGVYHKTLDVASIMPGSKVILDLGEVREVARVYLNGTDLGITWHAPYQYDVSHVLKEGQNYLVVEVANVLNNLMVGDASTPDAYKRTHSNITRGPNAWMTPWQDVSLKASGILGPAVLMFLWQNE
ncbi:MAG: hypothetical protein JJU28_06375 [Cyclobacteriaceae bacterium]|nr:hypothetical protein [Cyclobacteriaceae bacterium]